MSPSQNTSLMPITSSPTTATELAQLFEDNANDNNGFQFDTNFMIWASGLLLLTMCLCLCIVVGCVKYNRYKLKMMQIKLETEKLRISGILTMYKHIFHVLHKKTDTRKYFLFQIR